MYLFYIVDVTWKPCPQFTVDCATDGLTLKAWWFQNRYRPASHWQFLFDSFISSYTYYFVFECLPPGHSRRASWSCFSGQVWVLLRLQPSLVSLVVEFGFVLVVRYLCCGWFLCFVLANPPPIIIATLGYPLKRDEVERINVGCIERLATILNGTEQHGLVLKNQLPICVETDVHFRSVLRSPSNQFVLPMTIRSEYDYCTNKDWGVLCTDVVQNKL